jgi:hypothetical protein
MSNIPIININETPIITLYDKLPYEVQKHIVSYTVDNIENNIVHFFKFRKRLMISTRILNKLNYCHNYKQTICIYFSSAMHNHLLKYIKCIILLNDRLIISCFQNNFENMLVERKVFTIKDKKFFSYHNYLLHLCNKYNKKTYHNICFNR